MELPDDSIGITDLLAYRECPRRFSFGMRRHVGRAQQDQAAMPEADTHGSVWARSYGSALHDCIEDVEDGWSDDDAVQRAWNRHGWALEPEDLQLIRDDLEVYRQRDPKGVRAVAVEDEFRVPIARHPVDGRQIYFRFKLDRLYERLDRPGHFIHIDYKTSKHRKSDKEVHEDLQLWAYNFGIHEWFPECVDLAQTYDQLRFGQEHTRKSDAQRRTIRKWLERQVLAVLADGDVQDDGLLAPKFNEWCPYCSIMESCAVIPQLTDYSLTRIEALAPQRPKLKKDGTPGKVMETAPLDPVRLPEYLSEMEKAKKAAAVLKRFNESLGGLVKEMPAVRRAEFGYETSDRKGTTFTPDALREMHAMLGPRFYELLGITKSRLETELGEDAPELLERVLSLGTQTVGATTVRKRRDGGTS